MGRHDWVLWEECVRAAFTAAPTAETAAAAAPAACTTAAAAATAFTAAAAAATAATAVAEAAAASAAASATSAVATATARPGASQRCAFVRTHVTPRGGCVHEITTDAQTTPHNTTKPLPGLHLP